MVALFSILSIQQIFNKSEKSKTQKRNIIWFNPPFSKFLSTNVEKTFLQLVKKHLPRNHNFQPQFSYSRMNNMSKIIKRRNHVTKDQKVIAEKNQNVQWRGTVK